MNRCFLLFLCLILSVSFGCSQGPTCYFVEGTVTFKGEPLSKATIAFIPVDPDGEAVFASGMTDDNGRFTLTAAQFGDEGRGTTPGEYLVTIRRNKDEPSRTIPTDYGPASVYDSLIPQRYASQATSGLQAVVERKRNSFTFDLEER